MHQLIKPAIYSILTTLLWTGFAFGAEQDDSSLFVEAFNAFQKKDFLLVLEKLDQLNHIFPDTPLRDVSLLLQARAAHKSGDNELAAKSVNLFRSEFSDNALKNSIEDDLLKLGNRLNTGEKLPTDKKLRAAAQKIRATQLELERAAALKAEQERIAREQAERERIAKAKAEAERKERERIAAEIAAKANIKLEIVLPEAASNCEVGNTCHMPVQLVNKGTSSEDFLLSVPAAAEYAAILSTTETTGTKLGRVTLAAGKAFTCKLSFQMPADKVDGFLPRLPIMAVSSKFSDVSFSAQAHIKASAPLLRVVARPSTSKVQRGKSVDYRIIVLNAGSLAARNLKIKINPPDQSELLDSTGQSSFTLPLLEPGSLKEFNISAKVGERTQDKQELRCRIEISREQTGQKESFTSTPVTVITAAK